MLPIIIIGNLNNSNNTDASAAYQFHINNFSKLWYEERQMACYLPLLLKIFLYKIAASAEKPLQLFSNLVTVKSMFF